jgi:hypothetical protein
MVFTSRRRDPITGEPAAVFVYELVTHEAGERMATIVPLTAGAPMPEQATYAARGVEVERHERVPEVGDLAASALRDLPDLRDLYFTRG